jgi:ubiquinone/menaquinone biosynthesis C-methylase UbiE
MVAQSSAPGHIARGKSAQATDLIIERRYRMVAGYRGDSRGALLDFGCGNGAQTLLFVNDFDHITGVDVDEPSIRKFREEIQSRGLSGKVEALEYDGHTLPLPDASADFAISFEVLEHVLDERRALEELHRVLKPGARLAMSVPNRWWVFETHGAALPLLKWNRVPFFSWLPKSLHDRWARARIYSRGEIERKLREAGFEIVDSMYITAPMDVVKNRRVQGWLRRTLFRGDRTGSPFLSTAVLAIAARR